MVDGVQVDEAVDELEAEAAALLGRVERGRDRSVMTAPTISSMT